MLAAKGRETLMPATDAIPLLGAGRTVKALRDP